MRSQNLPDLFDGHDSSPPPGFGWGFAACINLTLNLLKRNRRFLARLRFRFRGQRGFGPVIVLALQRRLGGETVEVAAGDYDELFSA